MGRSSRRAYAYLLIPKARSLTEAAEKRLKTMLAATELGAGFHIAMKDLEIRGAGNIIGAEQSGQIHAVGFDLYTRLLANAVEELRARRAAGEEEAASPALPSAFGIEEQEQDPNIDEALVLPFRPAVELGIPASISPDYIPDLPTRLGIYHRLVGLAEVGGVDEMEDELRDRFGPLPWQAQNLLYVARLRLGAQRAGVESVTREDGRIVLRLKDDVGGARRALQRALGHRAQVGNTQVRLELDRLADGWQGPLTEAVERLADFRERVTVGVQAVGVSRA